MSPNQRGFRPTPFDQLLDLIQPPIQENSEQGEKIIHLAHGIMPEDKLDLSKSPAAQVKECDDKVNAFISHHFDRCEKSQLYQQASLRQWIEMSKPRINADKLLVKENISTGYVNSALSIAGILADFLNTSNAPLESITAANVMIRFVTEDNLMKKSDDLDLSPPGGTITWAILSDEVAEEKSTNNIVNVGVLRCARENPNVGSKMSHLYTLGAILYEILSQGDSSLVNALNLIGASKSRSFGAIDLMGEGERSDSSETIVHRKKKTPSDVMSNHYSKLVVCLERIGIPQSLCALVKNLLDCNEGEFCGDDAYKSFSDVILDLQLMRDHPSRFLYNIEVGHDHSFSISDKLYGREDEITRIEHACERSAKGECSAVMIVGEAGVGKSKLAMHVQDLTNKAHGYFVRCKFDQNKDIKPLSVIGSAFNYMCDMFARDIKTRHDEQRVADALESALGDPSSYCNLVEVLPSLSKLMPLYSNYGSSHSVDPATSTRFLFLTLLHTLSFHFSKPITIFLDDIQWIDQTSLMLLSSLIDHTKRNKFVFFVFCCRDGEIQDTHSEPVYISLRSLSKSVFEQINLTNLNADGVNTLVSDSLQLSPRLTRPLSLVLFSKTLGNPFFLRQTMNMLKKEGYIYFSLKGHRRRWMWDLEKISDLPIDENVLVLLIREMKKLPNDLQLGLKVASCMGASVNIHIVDILSRHCGVNLSTILLEASQKGYMYKDEIGTTQFRFVHDRVQQAGKCDI